MEHFSDNGLKQAKRSWGLKVKVQFHREDEILNYCKSLFGTWTLLGHKSVSSELQHTALIPALIHTHTQWIPLIETYPHTHVNTPTHIYWTDPLASEAQHILVGHVDTLAGSMRRVWHCEHFVIPTFLLLWKKILPPTQSHRPNKTPAKYFTHTTCNISGFWIPTWMDVYYYSSGSAEFNAWCIFI